MQQAEYDYLMKLFRAYKPEQLIAIIVYYQVESDNTSAESVVSPMDMETALEFIHIMTDTLARFTKNIIDKLGTDGTVTKR